MSTSSDRGLFVWHEVGTTDLRAGEDFYAKVAGWKAESWSQNPSYKLFVARREPKAGLYLITETVNAVPTPPAGSATSARRMSTRRYGRRSSSVEK